MLNWLTRGSAVRRKAGDIYGAVVAQARQPSFYSALGIPDTPVGRFEAIVLHMVLVLERLRADGASSEDLQRHLIERFVTDMDDQMREMGVGDLSVPKKVKRGAAVLYARIAAFRAGLAAAEEQPLVAAVATAFADAGATSVAARPIALYMRSAASLLSGSPTAELERGVVIFPPAPEAAS